MLWQLFFRIAYKYFLLWLGAFNEYPHIYIMEKEEKYQYVFVEKSVLSWAVSNSEFSIELQGLMSFISRKRPLNAVIAIKCSALENKHLGTDLIKIGQK